MLDMKLYNSVISM